MPAVSRQTPTKKAARKKAAASGDVWDRIDDISFEEEGLKVCLYGKSGSGKTTFWSSFPGPILSIICSGGAKPGELRSVNTKEMRQKIKTVTLQESGEILTLCQKQQETGRFATVVLDHSTGLQDLVLTEILGLKDIPIQKSWGMATQQQYGTCASQCKELFRSLLNLDCNVVLVSQERETIPDESASDILQPCVGAALMPSLAGWLYPACDYIVQMYKRGKTVKKTLTINGKQREREERVSGVEYCLRVGPDDTYITKFRVPKGAEVPEFIEDPDYPKLKKLIDSLL